MQEAKRSELELSWSSVLTGLLIGIVMTAANVYLGLYAGMTVSASIPAAVIATAIYRGLLRDRGVKQVNIVQTIASAGESLAAGVIFTLPALVLVGAWTDFEFWPTTLIAVWGGLLGVLFLFPWGRVFITPRGVRTPLGVGAWAVVINNPRDSGNGSSWYIVKGVVLGGLVKLLTGGLGLLLGSVETAFVLARRVVYVGFDS